MGNIGYGPSIKKQTNLDSGLYYIKVSRYSGITSGNFSIKVTKIAEDLEGDTKENATQLEVGETAVRLNYATDIDYYKIEAPYKGTYKVVINSTQEDGSSLYLYSKFQSEKEELTSYHSGGTKFEVQITQVKGTYYFKIVRSSGVAEGNHTLSLTRTEKDLEGDDFVEAQNLFFQATNKVK